MQMIDNIDSLYKRQEREAVRDCPNIDDLRNVKDRIGHTMGLKLVTYVSTKFTDNQKRFIKSCIRRRVDIEIHGVFESHIGSCLRANSIIQKEFDTGEIRLERLHRNAEKKTFNIHRPFFISVTTSDGQEKALLITFPSKEYLSQYAELLHAYVKLNLQAITRKSDYRSEFDFSLDEASQIEDHYTMKRPLFQIFYPETMLNFQWWSGLSQIVGKKIVVKDDVVVLGYVDQLREILIKDYNFDEISGPGFKRFGLNEIFGITVLLAPTNRRRLVLIGCSHSFWGRTASKIVSVCLSEGAKEIIYCAKAGTRTGSFAPTKGTDQATNNLCIIGGKYLIWENLSHRIEGTIREVSFQQADPSLAGAFTEKEHLANRSQTHLSVPTVVGEDFRQAKSYTSHGPTTIDNEISYIAEEIGHFQIDNSTRKIAFSCIHFMTDLVVGILTPHLIDNQGLETDRLENPHKLNFLNEAAAKIATYISTSGAKGSDQDSIILGVESNALQETSIIHFPSNRFERLFKDEQKANAWATQVLKTFDLENNTETFVSFIEGLHPGDSGVVIGEPGVGLSVLAESCFHFIEFRHQLNQTPMRPYYIDLLSHEKALVKSSLSPDEFLDRILKVLESVIANTGPRVILFDGIDAISPFAPAFIRYLETEIGSDNRRMCTVLYFCRRYRNERDEEFCSGHILGVDVGIHHKFVVGPNPESDVGERPSASGFLGLLKLTSGAADEDILEVLNRVEGWSDFSENLKLLRLVLDRELHRKRKFTTPIEFLKDFFDQYMQQHSAKASRNESRSLAAKRAFQFMVVGKPFPTGDPHSMLVKRVATQSTEMLCYLAAVHLDIEIFDKRSYSEDRVFPYLINKYSKELLREREPEIAFEILEKSLRAKNSPIRLKAFLAYLVGRIIDPQVRDRCVDLLQSLARQTEEGDDHLQLTYDRSINISLIYLGESAQEYIGSMMKSSNKDRVNRGFHLAYYGDIDYFSDTDMLSPDDGTHNYEKTESYLLKNMKRNDSNVNLINLWTFTLYSLAFSRFYGPNSRNTDSVSRLVEFAHTTLLQRAELFENVKSFVSNCVRYFESNLNPHQFGYHQISKLKRHLRAGWNSEAKHRRVVQPESVLSHVGGAVYIAVTYLPENSLVAQLVDKEGYGEEYRSYNKDRIVRMLVVHDVGEFEFGDIPTPLKNAEDNAREKGAVEFLSLLSRNNPVHASVGFSADTLPLWLEFEEGRTMNARIANEIDKIECFIQLNAYAFENESHFESTDLESFRRYLRDSVKTYIGSHLLKQFTR